MSIKSNYKQTVSALIFSPDNQILMTHNRSHGPGFWKFLQGGVEKNESKIMALEREIKEELGDIDYQIIGESDLEYKYDWPEHVQQQKGYKGPELSFYFIKLLTNEFNLPIDSEIDDTRWISLEEVPNNFTQLPEFLPTLNRLLTQSNSLL